MSGTDKDMGQMALNTYPYDDSHMAHFLGTTYFRMSDVGDMAFRLHGPGGVIPEPSTLIIWSLLGGLGITVGWCRRRRRAA